MHPLLLLFPTKGESGKLALRLFLHTHVSKKQGFFFSSWYFSTSLLKSFLYFKGFCLSRWSLLHYRNFTWISFCYLLTPIFCGKFRKFFTNNSAPKKIQWTTNCPKNLHVKNEVVLWPQTSSKIIVLVAQPIFTDGGPPLRKGLELL